MGNADNALLALRESEMLELWTRCFLRPTFDFAETFQNGGFGTALHEMFRECPDGKINAAIETLDSFREEVSSKDTEAVRLMFETDYNRLFVGPARLFAPPYESFYKTEVGEDGRGRLRGPSEREVFAEYRRHGYTMPDEFIELPDHIAVQLEFLAILARQESEAWEADDEVTALSLEKDAENFRSEHLGSWFVRFSEGVGEGSRYPFYPAMVVLVNQTVLI